MKNEYVALTNRQNWKNPGTVSRTENTTGMQNHDEENCYL